MTDSTRQSTRRKQQAVLKRETFRTSREMDFFSEKELTTQTGHGIEEWPLVFLKETIDNALDACEEANATPEIEVTATPRGITVSDNGPGIPAETIAGAMDFTVRVSNREMYVAPDRGAQGNALMTLLSMPYVVDPIHGRLNITANGVSHDIVCRADPITQRAIVEDDTRDADGRTGTTVSVLWGARSDDDGAVVWPFADVCPVGTSSRYSLQDRAVDLLSGYAVFNPHVTLSVRWFDSRLTYEATDPGWQKWKPNKPTSPHWYELKHFERLIAAYITRDRERGQDRTVSAFLAEFDGLTGTAKRKAVLQATGLARVSSSCLTNSNGLDSPTITRLLMAMKNETKPVKPPRLGIIGREHFTTRYREPCCEPESIEYSKKARVDEGLPFVLESCFGWFGENSEDRRRIFAGANCPPGITNPFRSFGGTGEGLEAYLREMRAGATEPVAFALHLAHPRNDINAIDLGLRLEDVEKWGLESEPVVCNTLPVDLPATDEEREFLLSGQRVELNAFTSEDFISRIESKLEEHGIKKVIPDAKTLDHAYRRAYQIVGMNRRMAEIADDAREAAEAAKIPKGLRKRIEAALAEDPARPWDAVLAEIAEERLEDSS